MSLRIVGKGMKLVMTGRKLGVVVIDGEGLEVSFTPSAVKILSAKFQDYIDRTKEDGGR